MKRLAVSSLRKAALLGPVILLVGLGVGGCERYLLKRAPVLAAAPDRLEASDCNRRPQDLGWFTTENLQDRAERQCAD